MTRRKVEETLEARGFIMDKKHAEKFVCVFYWCLGDERTSGFLFDFGWDLII